MRSYAKQLDTVTHNAAEVDSGQRAARIAWTYDSLGRTISSQHDGGADLTTFAYDDVNNKVTVTNPLGRQTVYSYQLTQQVT